MSIKKIIAAVMTSGLMLTVVPMTSLADSTGWIQDSNGWKYYTYEDGLLEREWKKIDGKWYYFNGFNYMVSNAVNYKIDGKYYDFSASGECLNPDGKTELNQGWNKVGYSMIDSIYSNVPGIYYYWVYVEGDGSLHKGWLNDGGKWYYFSEIDGEMIHTKKGDAPYYINQVPYFFKEGSGEMLTGWIKEGDNWYYADSDGKMYLNRWFFSGGKWYYFDSLGVMYKDFVNIKIDDVYYTFDSTGACTNPSGTTDLGTGWVRRSNTYNNPSWGYFDEQGNEYTGWHKIDGSWYFFSDDGVAYVQTLLNDGNFYGFKANGQMITGWYKDSYFSIAPNWHYAGSDGALYRKKWLNDGGKWYYIDSSFCMVSNVENYLIDGKYYSFDSTGACKNPSGLFGELHGWLKVSIDHWLFYDWVYYDDNGEMYKEKWLNYAGKWYYFDKDGCMVDRYGYTVKSENKEYDFDKNGVCLNPDNPRAPKQS